MGIIPYSGFTGLNNILYIKNIFKGVMLYEGKVNIHYIYCHPQTDSFIVSQLFSAG